MCARGVAGVTGRLQGEYRLPCRSALAVAKDPQHSIRTVAFPALGCGERGYPLWDAAAIALDECAAHAEGLESVSFVFKDEESAQPFFFQAVAMFPVVARLPSLHKDRSLCIPDSSLGGLAAKGGGAPSSHESPDASLKQRQSSGSHDAVPSLDTLHVHSAAGSAMLTDAADALQSATAAAARGDDGGGSVGTFRPDLAALEARHDRLFNQQTQMDTFADSRAFQTLPLAPAEPPRDPGSHASPRERLDYIQQQLQAFGLRGPILRRFELLESRCRGGAPPPHSLCGCFAKHLYCTSHHPALSCS